MSDKDFTAGYQAGYRAAMQDVLTILNTATDVSIQGAIREFVETGLGVR
jgi:hypothetical protein